jgi:hypothetical protein
VRKLVVGGVIFVLGLVAGLSASALATPSRFSGSSVVQAGEVLRSTTTFPPNEWTEIPGLLVHGVCGGGGGAGNNAELSIQVTLAVVSSPSLYYVRVLVNQQVAQPESFSIDDSFATSTTFLDKAGTGGKSIHVQVMTPAPGGGVVTAGSVNVLGANVSPSC